jgi:5-methylcytosine-specific restriction endonuclease McrA
MMLDYEYIQSWVEQDTADDIQRLRELDRADYAQSWRDMEADDEEGGEPRPLIDAVCDAFVQCERAMRGGSERGQLARLPYQQYLRTPHWQAMRKRALLRAGFQCKRCEVRGQRLDVHHLSYDRLGRELESDLTVLCELCHAGEHAK